MQAPCVRSPAKNSAAPPVRSRPRGSLLARYLDDAPIEVTSDANVVEEELRDESARLMGLDPEKLSQFTDLAKLLRSFLPEAREVMPDFSDARARLADLLRRQGEAVALRNASRDATEIDLLRAEVQRLKALLSAVGSIASLPQLDGELVGPPEPEYLSRSPLRSSIPLLRHCGSPAVLERQAQRSGRCRAPQFFLRWNWAVEADGVGYSARIASAVSCWLNKTDKACDERTALHETFRNYHPPRRASCANCPFAQSK